MSPRLLAIFSGKPAFLKFDSKTGKLVMVPRLREGIRIIVPPRPENYPAYAPYEFESLEEAEKYLERARHDSIDSLYSEAHKIASDYNDQSPEERKLLAIEIIASGDGRREEDSIVDKDHPSKLQGIEEERQGHSEGNSQPSSAV